MKIVISVVLGCVFGGGLAYLLTQPAQPWALASSGSGLGGVSIRGIFATEEGCLMFRKLYLMRHKTTAEDHETKVEYYEGAGIVETSAGRWYTASCLPLNAVSGLSGPTPDLSGVEDALRDIATNTLK